MTTVAFAVSSKSCHRNLNIPVATLTNISTSQPHNSSENSNRQTSRLASVQYLPKLLLPSSSIPPQKSRRHAFDDELITVARHSIVFVRHHSSLLPIKQCSATLIKTTTEEKLPRWMEEEEEGKIKAKKCY